MYLISKVVRQKKELAQQLDGDDGGTVKQFSRGRTRGVTGEVRLKDVTRHELYAIKTKRLADSEIRALRITWNRLKGSGGHFTTRLMQDVFERLTQLCPELKGVFCKAAFVHALVDNAAYGGLATIADHARFLDDYIQDCIDFASGFLTRPPSMPGNIASRHFALTPLGMQQEFWEQLGMAMSELIGKQDCVRAYPDAPRAWNLFIAALTDFFSHGYERAERQPQMPLWQRVRYDQTNASRHRKQSLAVSGRRASMTSSHGRSRSLSLVPSHSDDSSTPKLNFTVAKRNATNPHVVKERWNRTVQQVIQRRPSTTDVQQHPSMVSNQTDPWPRKNTVARDARLPDVHSKSAERRLVEIAGGFGRRCDGSTQTLITGAVQAVASTAFKVIHQPTTKFFIVILQPPISAAGRNCQPNGPVANTSVDSGEFGIASITAAAGGKKTTRTTRWARDTNEFGGAQQPGGMQTTSESDDTEKTTFAADKQWQD